MPGLEQGLPAEQRIILAIDTSERTEATRLTYLARDAGATAVKMGLEISSAESWKWCSNASHRANLDWVADAKIDDIPTTTAGIVRNLARLPHPPIGITIHTNSGRESMEAAEEIAAETGITLLGVTQLTSIDDAETKGIYGYLRSTLVKRRAEQAADAGIGGLVASPREVGRVIRKSKVLADMVTMIPGTRSQGSETHDQKNALTPYRAIVDGADLLVIGRQITKSKDPAAEYGMLVQEIQHGINTLEKAA